MGTYDPQSHRRSYSTHERTNQLIRSVLDDLTAIGMDLRGKAAVQEFRAMLERIQTRDASQLDYRISANDVQMTDELWEMLEQQARPLAATSHEEW